MSSYKQQTLNPSTGKWEDAEWLDDYFSNHHYGVRFADGTIVDPWKVKLETRDYEEKESE